MHNVHIIKVTKPMLSPPPPPRQDRMATGEGGRVGGWDNINKKDKIYFLERITYIFCIFVQAFYDKIIDLILKEPGELSTACAPIETLTTHCLCPFSSISRTPHFPQVVPLFPNLENPLLSLLLPPFLENSPLPSSCAPFAPNWRIPP